MIMEETVMNVVALAVAIRGYLIFSKILVMTTAVVIVRNFI